MALKGSEHGSLDGSSIESPSRTSSMHKEKDELAVSRRGSCPVKKQPSQHSNNEAAATTTGEGTEEDTIGAELERMKEEEKSWNFLDSVHSTQHRGPVFGGVYFDRNHSDEDDSSALEDSCASFSSFTGGDDSGSDLMLMEQQRAAFTNLEPEMTPRRFLLDARQPSSRVIRQPSRRLSNLELIGEDDSIEPDSSVGD